MHVNERQENQVNKLMASYTLLVYMRYVYMHEVAVTSVLTRRTMCPELVHKHLFAYFYSSHCAVSAHKLYAHEYEEKGRTNERDDSVNASRKKAICYLLCNSRVKQIMNHSPFVRVR